MADRPTILLDVSAGVDGEYTERFLERQGHEVLVCHGPGEGELCPLLQGAGCDHVDDAHGIVFDLDLDRPQHRDILARYEQVTHGDVPIRVVVRPGQRERYPELLGGVEVWDGEPSSAELDGFSAEVEAADRLA